MDIGVFIPIGNNGWLMSTTSPQYKPTFDLNREIVQRAEHYGFDFALSMIKLRGFGGKSEFWDHNLESFTLMSGLAAVTTRIKLFASVATLTMPPAFAARMAVTIDSISHGRFGINMVTGWQPAEYTQMGIWPGDSWYERRYEHCAEYVTVMRDLWATGRSDHKGDFFQMEDCRCSPLPSTHIDIITAAQSDAGTKFAAEYSEYNFCSGIGINTPTRVGDSVARLVAATKETGRKCGALVLTMVIADETDEAAMAKWNLYKAGVDLDAIHWRTTQAQTNKTKDPYSTANRRFLTSPKDGEQLPTNGGVLIGSYASVAGMLDEIAAIPGVQGCMLTFDDFIQGVEQFGQHIQPLMKSRAKALAA